MIRSIVDRQRLSDSCERMWSTRHPIAPSLHVSYHEAQLSGAMQHMDWYSRPFSGAVDLRQVVSPAKLNALSGGVLGS